MCTSERVVEHIKVMLACLFLGISVKENHGKKCLIDVVIFQENT